MEIKPNPKVLANFLINHIDEILMELDVKEAETKQKHYVVVRCTDAKNYTPNKAETAYNFSFHKVDSPRTKLLNLEMQEALLNTRLNKDVCFIVADDRNRLTMINHKRDMKANRP